jgi:hypothetical protein
MTRGVMGKLGILRVAIPISQSVVVVFWVFNSCLSVSSYEKVPSRIGNSRGIPVFILTQKQWSSYRELIFPLSNWWVMSRGIRVTACELRECRCCTSRIFLFPMLKEYKGLYVQGISKGRFQSTHYVESIIWKCSRGCGLGKKKKWPVELKREIRVILTP